MRRNLIILILLLFAVHSAFCSGIKVTPGTILVQNIPVGKQFDFFAEQGLTLKIYNTEDYPKRYLLSPNRPSEMNTTATGYFDILDPSWFSLDTNSVTVPPGETAEIGMRVSIPDNSSWYNRHWLIGIDVSEDTTGKTLPGQAIIMGAYLLYRLETEPLDGVVPETIGEEIITVPSVLDFGKVKRGEKYERTITVYQKIEPAVHMKIYSLDPESDVAKLTILINQPYQRVKNPDWFSYKEKLSVKNGEGKELRITLNVPENAGETGKYYEEILLLDGKMCKGFVRLHFKLIE